MKEFTIGPNDAGQRLDRFLAKAVPLLPASLAQKYIRLKRIKLGGKRVDRDTRLKEGDVLQLYINDEFFDKPREDNAYLTVAVPKLNIVYEDEHILLVDKILLKIFLLLFYILAYANLLIFRNFQILVQSELLHSDLLFYYHLHILFLLNLLNIFLLPSSEVVKVPHSSSNVIRVL